MRTSLIYRLVTGVALSVALAVVILAPSAAAAPPDAKVKRLGDCTLNISKVDDCDFTHYAYRAVGMIIPGAITGILVFLICPWYFCCRFCCGCCGGSQPRSGCFCAGDQPAIYSTADIIRPKLYTIILVGMGIALCIWGNVGTGLMVKGLLGLADDVENVPNVLVAQIDKITASMNVTIYNATTDTDEDKNLFSGTSVQTDALKLKKDLDDSLKGSLNDFRDYVNQFSSIMFVIFSFPILLTFLSGLSALCSIRSCFPMLVSFFFFLWCFFFYLSYGVFGAVGLVIGDLCAEIHAIKLGERNLFKPLIGCNDELFEDFQTNFRKIEGDVSNDACVEIKKLCYDNSKFVFENINDKRIFDCSTGFTCSKDIRFVDIIDLLANKIAIHPAVDSFPGAANEGYTCSNKPTKTNCTIGLCSTNCLKNGARSEIGKAAKLVYSTFLAANKVSTVIDTLGGEYGSCDSLFGIVLIPFDYSCQMTTNGTIALFEAAGFGGVTAFLTMYIMAWGSKRFMSLSDLNAPEGEDLEADPGVGPKS